MSRAPEIELSLDDLRAIGAWAGECAERSMPLFEAAATGDSRPREALEALREFVDGGRRTAKLRTVVWAALAAAKDAGDPIALQAARAAAYAAGSAYLHPLAAPTQAKHILGPAVAMAQAKELAAGGDPGVGDGEIRWAIEHASPIVGEVLRRIPPGNQGRTRAGVLYQALDAGLRNQNS